MDDEAASLKRRKGTSILEQSRGDRFGIALSTLCIIHCLAVPAILALLPLATLESLPEWVRENEWFHALLLVPVALVSGPILWRAARSKPLIGVLGVGGFVALAAGLIVPDEVSERWLTALGASVILAAHLLNLKSLNSAARARGLDHHA